MTSLRLLLFVLPFAAFADLSEKAQNTLFIAQESSSEEEMSDPSLSEDTLLITPPHKKVCKEKKRWYFEVEPGYYYFLDSDMREFFSNGGFTIRAETGYRFWRPLTVWIDASYFQKDGSAIGGTEKLHLKLASLTLGLKAIFDIQDWVSVYFGAGPRVFMMLLKNKCDFVREEDNQVGIGGGFDGGFRFSPLPKNRDIFIDIFADYSLKTLKIEEDADCSFNNDVNISGLTVGGSLGIRF